MILIILYSVFLLLATVLWLSMTATSDSQNTEKVTVIVVVRNEEDNIENLLLSFKKQTYTNFEIVLVDDNSTDKTVAKAKKCNLSNLKIIHLTDSERKNTPKKSGIEKAISISEGSIIFSTDGDCILPPEIIETYASMFTNPNVHFISGPVVFSKKATLWNKIQTVEFSSLIGSAAVAISLRSPIMSSAANLAYRKTSFIEVDGFQDNHNLASGDDELLMNKINKRFKNSVLYAKNKKCIVETNATENLKQFYNQRKRWAGKWSSSINIISKLVAILVFCLNASCIYFLFTGKWEILSVRLITEFIFLASVLLFLKRAKTIIFIPLTQLIYPFYVVFFGLLSLKPGKYKWKNRELE